MNEKLEKALEQMTESRIYHTKKLKDGESDYLIKEDSLEEKQEELFEEIMKYGRDNAFDVDEYVRKLR
jgi:hypothetical protein